VIGSKLINRQEKNLVRCPRRTQESTRQANEADSGPVNPAWPAAAVDLGVFSSLVPSASQENQPSPNPMVDQHFIIMHNMTTGAAIACISHILQIKCTEDAGFNVGAIICTLPAPIVPTIQQQVVPHRTYVDVLPWASLRDRILNSLAVINEAELIGDITSGELKVWGSTPWDPMGWEVGPDFARKWWFLMDDAVMRTTNFWRAQRGEEALLVAPSQPSPISI
jgi:hypothetical protein